MKKQVILQRGMQHKVLVKWIAESGTFANGTNEEYSVHTLDLEGGLIWGHYFNNLEDAEEYFSQYRW